MRTTASELVVAIDQLPKDRQYNYVAKATRTKFVITQVARPEGPIKFKRFDPAKGETPAGAEEESISTSMLWRVANAIRVGEPLNLDRMLGGSYNTRSVLEAMLANTPQFYFCKPGRIEVINSNTKFKPGHKHLIWLPNDPHEPGVILKKETEIVISEIPSSAAIYEALVLPQGNTASPSMDIDTARRHAQIQIALVLIGNQLGFRTYVARNDQGIVYNNKRLGEMKGVVTEIGSEQLVATHTQAAAAARLIDCVWFRNAKFMPAVIEVEQSTGVTSGLSRMKNFQDLFPPFPTRWVIAAPDDDRHKVFQECNKPQFASLAAKYLPYSAVDELLSLCQRRKLRGVNDDFLDCFMEPTVN